MLQPRLLTSEGTIGFISSPEPEPIGSRSVPSEVSSRGCSIHKSGHWWATVQEIEFFLCDPFLANASGTLAGKTRMGYEIRRLVHSNRELENQ